MPDVDDLLERQLNALEQGAELEDVLAALPESAAELAPLIRLAATVRTVPHPEPESLAAPLHRPKPQPTKERKFMFPRIHFPKLRLQGAAALCGALALAIVAGLWFTGPAAASSATLTSLNGRVEVAEQGSADWRLADHGTTVHAGDRVRTVGASSATLAFYEGTKTVLAPNTEITLQELGGGWGNSLQVAISQDSGRSNHKVIPLRGNSSFYNVYTPGGKATVHGTSFEVDVNEAGTSRFAVNTGKVEVTQNQSQVFVTAGQVASAEPDAGLSAPTYQFTVSGELTSIDGSSWTVAGVPFMVMSETAINAELVVGAQVVVEGRVLEDGTRVADSISPLDTEESVPATFTGTLEAINADSWVISGTTVLVNTETNIETGIAIGQPVKVTFMVLADDQWLALQIIPLVETEDPTETDPTATPDPAAAPNLLFMDSDLSTTSCGTSASFSSTLWNDALELDDFAANVELGYILLSGADQVESVEINPASWERLEMGQQAGFTVNVTLKEGWNQALSDINLQVYVAHETNAGEHAGRLNLTVSCDQEPTEEPTNATPDLTLTPDLTTTPDLTLTPDLTGTPDLTATPEVTGTPEPEEEDNNPCSGGKQHPTGLTLANRYGVPYEEIMGWFCQQPHFGFGEIDLAYQLAQEVNLKGETTITVEEIFAMKSSGMGWGEIKKTLDPKEEKTKEPKPTKTPKPEKTKGRG